jgi:hypothetical protein
VILSRPQFGPVLGLFYLALLWLRPRDLGRLVGSGLIAVALASSQLVVWYVLQGTIFSFPHGDDYLQSGQHRFFDVLFSLKNGLVSWTPFMAVAIAGLIYGTFASKHRLIFALCLFGFGIEVYINSIGMDWWGGNAFGYRRLIEIYPLLLLGVALLMSLNRRSFTAIAAFAVVCAVFNALFFVQYRFCYIPRGKELTLQQLLTDKLRLNKLDRPYC